MKNASETWQRVDELSDAYGRLADRRAATWRQLTAHRMAGATRQAARLESQLQQMDVQGLRLAERIDELCTAGLNYAAAAAATQKGIGGA